ncbi:hypothetical protein B0H14DRAFT_3447581 [Mycena olivaceomarginata]|nr:hypothetical protein B0H14DRAFT_3447581 [Mycena olivaceomarginata]
MGQGRVCRHEDGCAEAETGGGGTGCVWERMGGGCRSGVDVGRNWFAERAGQDGRGGAEAGGRAVAVDAGAGVREGHGRAAKAGDADTAYGAWWSGGGLRGHRHEGRGGAGAVGAGERNLGGCTLATGFGAEGDTYMHPGSCGLVVCGVLVRRMVRRRQTGASFDRRPDRTQYPPPCTPAAVSRVEISPHGQRRTRGTDVPMPRQHAHPHLTQHRRAHQPSSSRIARHRGARQYLAYYRPMDTVPYSTSPPHVLSLPRHPLPIPPPHHPTRSSSFPSPPPTETKKIGEYSPPKSRLPLIPQSPKRVIEHAGRARRAREADRAGDAALRAFSVERRGWDLWAV